MSRDAVRFGRVPKREKAKILDAMQKSRMRTMETRVMTEMANDQAIIETIVRAHFDTCDFTADKIQPFKNKAKADQAFTSVAQTSAMNVVSCPMKGRPETFFLEQFSERFMDHVRQVCTFAKSIPGFKCLHHEDQVTLLKSCVFEVLLVRLSGLFDNESLVCLNGDLIKRETISSMPAGNAKFLMDSVFELAQRINRFRLADAEIGLFCAVVIITQNRPGLRNPELVGKMQEKLKMVLKKILANPQRSEHGSIFHELETIILDLRTLNTLHTEKFLQQGRVEMGQHFTAERDWEAERDGERDSTGSRSPQSSDCGLPNNQLSSWEDMRRSPIGSVSSSESLSSETGQNFIRLSVNDLKIHGVGSVLLNALTTPTVSAAPQAARKRDISRCASEGSIHPRPQEEAQSAVPEPSKCPFKARKLESPSDSGIDSPKAQGSHSTNTSVCSSPRSSMEEKVKEVDDVSEVKVERPTESLEDAHPLLKRALQQPPQPYHGSGGVTNFQDEVYKPHKKFRHSGRKDSDEPTSTQESATSPDPSCHSMLASHSILASQLAAPPSFTQPRNQQPTSSSSGISLLASTLSRPITVPRAREAEKAWLENILLRGRPVTNSAGPSSSSSLLMCAPLPAHSHIPNYPETTAGVSSWPSSPHPPSPSPRHIPVPVAPTQPTSSLHPAPAPAPTASKTSHLKMALAGLEAPLNLSTKTGSTPADIPLEA